MYLDKNYGQLGLENTNNRFEPVLLINDKDIALMNDE